MGDGASIETETGLDSSVIAEMKEGDRPTVSTGVAAAMIGRVAEATVEADQGAETEKATDGGATDGGADLNRRIDVRLKGRLTPRQMRRGLRICSARRNFSRLALGMGRKCLTGRLCTIALTVHGWIQNSWCSAQLRQRTTALQHVCVQEVACRTECY